MGYKARTQMGVGGCVHVYNIFTMLGSSHLHWCFFLWQRRQSTDSRVVINTRSTKIAPPPAKPCRRCPGNVVKSKAFVLIIIFTFLLTHNACTCILLASLVHHAIHFNTRICCINGLLTSDVLGVFQEGKSLSNALNANILSHFHYLCTT